MCAINALNGEGEYLTVNGPVPVKPGDTTFAPAGEWQGFRNTGSGKAVLVTLYSPAAALQDCGYKTYRGGGDRPGRQLRHRARHGPEARGREL